jgi:hypothetical protein
MSSASCRKTGYSELILSRSNPHDTETEPRAPSQENYDVECASAFSNEEELIGHAGR